ncbi:MAG: type II and III secretion system protein family protein [Desulfobulbaceae bacterium]|nr:type II and III secretion system protein family protein [Desulfobulbaceae bacterium]
MNRRHANITTGAVILALLVLLCGQAWGGEALRNPQDLEIWGQKGGMPLELEMGSSRIIDTKYPVDWINIANPAVADVLVLTPKQIYVLGKTLGYTKVMLGQQGQARSMLDITVTLDATGLKEKLYQLYPSQQINVYGSEKGIVLSGTVTGPEVIEEVLRLAQSYLPAGAAGGGGAGTGKSGAGITNLLKVGGNQQVLLEVKFAEVTRDTGKGWQFGLGYGKAGSGSDVRGAAGIGKLGVTDFGALSALNAGSVLMNFTSNIANVFVNIENVTAALQFLETEGLARTLAEPRLITLSGQQASFLAGGEFPIPVPDANGNTTITFKDYGVALTFTPIVLSDGRISLRVSPQVSDVVYTSAVPAAGSSGAQLQIPSLTTRKLDTTVELHDGQSLALAGLLQDNITETVKKIPGLGDIPILGALFRSSSFTQKKTDLLIAVTPHIVKPVKEGSLSFPGDHFKIPDRYEFYLEGRLEGRRSVDDQPGLSRHDFAPQQPAVEKQGGLEGAFGHQPVAAE